MSSVPFLRPMLPLFFLALVTLTCKKQEAQVQPLPPPPNPGALQGKVLNEYNQLLPGAVVALQGNGTNATATTANGSYIFTSLQPGSYTLSVKKDDYIETSVTVSITSGDTLTKDIVLKAGTGYFTLLSDTVIIASPFATTFTIKVASNTTWAITSANNWITPTKLNGGGNDSVAVQIAASSADTVRQGSISIQAGSIARIIVVKQLPNVKLQQTIALPGNLALGISDSIALVFNQPVTIKSLIPGYTLCQSDIKFSYAGNKVSFSYACAALGGNYPFTITTQNSLGDQFTFNFTAGFYEKVLNLTGTIQSSFVNDADNSYWIITDHPNVLYKIDMTSLQVLHKYDLPDEPVMFTVNPYNNKIYVAYRGTAKLYVLNQDGTTDQVIDIPHDVTRGIYEYNGPIIYPRQLVFTKNGKGMIWLSDASSSNNYYWFIDAAANHRIWYQPLPGNPSNYVTAKANYDLTKLVLMSPNDDPTIGIFDPQLMIFSNYKPANSNRGFILTPSRKNGNIYSGQLYSQLIVNPATGFESLQINRNITNGGNADFCYKPGKEQTIYYAENGYLEAIDYTTRKSPVKYDAIYYLRGITATLDGKYILAYWHNGNYSAKVIQLPTTWFDY